MRARDCDCPRAILVATALFAPLHGSAAIKIIMPAPAGGAGDIVARILAEQVGRAQGRTLVIENRAGAGTIIGTEAVARAAPDVAPCLSLRPIWSLPRICENSISIR